MTPTTKKRAAKINGAGRRLAARKPRPDEGALLPLTKRQAEMLAAIVGWMVRHGTSPTYDEMAHEMGMNSDNAVWSLVRPLLAKGYLEVVPRSSRGFRVPGLQIRAEVEIGTPAGRRLREALEMAEGREA